MLSLISSLKKMTKYYSKLQVSPMMSVSFRFFSAKQMTMRGSTFMAKRAEGGVKARRSREDSCRGFNYEAFQCATTTKLCA